MLRSLLAYLGNASLAGSTAALKEYTIGVEVFGRGASFDAASDTIVRVQARRLRAKLESFYQGEGKQELVEIRLPKGRYLLEFWPRGAAAGLTASMVEASTSLPAPRTPLIGRTGEVEQIRRMFLEKRRLVTLTGPGGSGKTRVAIAAGQSLKDSFPGGVSFVSLAHTTDPDMAAAILAQWLGLPDQGPANLDNAILSRLRAIGDPARLLILDNCEQLLAVAPLFGRLLDASDSLSIMVTSRSALGLYGEQEFPIKPFALPRTDADAPIHEIRENFAVRLFRERAKALKPEFELSETNTLTVARICARLDGLPLAIELAAVRVRVLSEPQILERLIESFDSLPAGASDLAQRRHTLRSVVDWSYRLLSGPEQKLFARLSVFAGGCTLESAEAVANPKFDLGLDVIEGVSSLVTRNLLHSDADPRAGQRFTMLATVREYALQLLREQGADNETRLAHAAYCIVVAREGANVPRNSLHREWLRLCESEHDNFRVALDWLIGTRKTEWAAKLARALYGFWEAREYLSEGSRYLLAVVELMGETPTKERAWFLGIAASLSGFEASAGLSAEALEVYRAVGDRRGIAAGYTSMGTLEKNRGSYAESIAYLQEALTVTRELGDESECAAAMSNLATSMSGAQKHAEATELLLQALEIFTRLGDRTTIGWTLNRLGDVQAAQGNIEEARRLHRQSIAVFERAGDRIGTARCFLDLGLLALAQSDPERARPELERALEAFAEVGYQRGVARALESLSMVYAMQRDYARTLVLAAAADSMRRRIGWDSRPVQRDQVERWLQTAWHFLGDSAIRLWHAARRLSLADALEIARNPSSRSSAALLEIGRIEHAPDCRYPVEGEAR